jgi:hypothetical protein
VNLFFAILLTFGVSVVKCAALAFPLMWLWNSTFPELFHFPVISAWMSFKLSLFCGFLFQSWSSDK